jgi:peptide/nickel transport system permease protein
MANTNYFIERTIQAVLTLLTVFGLTFALLRLMPGGPMAYLRAQLAQSGQDMTQEEIDARIELYTSVHPDKPIPVAFVDYTTSLLQGDLGKSLWYNQPVMDIIAQAMPWTIFISAVSLLGTFAIGITLGALMAYSEGSRFDLTSSTVSIIITSIPFYVVAVLLVWMLGYQFNIFPTGGRVNTDLTPGMTPEFISSVLYHGALPIASLVIAGFGGRALSMRGNSIQILGNDYLRVARLRGLSERRIALRYVGRNAILPMYTSIMIAIGTLFGGSIILEMIFLYPGLGYYVFQSLGARDYPLLMGGFLFITIATILGIYIADLTYGRLNPRVEAGRGEAQ